MQEAAHPVRSRNRKGEEAAISDKGAEKGVSRLALGLVTLRIQAKGADRMLNDIAGKIYEWILFLGWFPFSEPRRRKVSLVAIILIFLIIYWRRHQRLKGVIHERED